MKSSVPYTKCKMGQAITQKLLQFAAFFELNHVGQDHGNSEQDEDDDALGQDHANSEPDMSNNQKAKPCEKSKKEARDKSNQKVEPSLYDMHGPFF